MNYLKSSAICVLLSFCFTSAMAQFTPPLPKTDLNKPKLFADLSDKMEASITEMEALLALPEGSTVNVHLGRQFNYHGKIVSKSDAADVLVKSVVIQSINRQGATLTFTKVANAEGGFSYSGRILSFQHSDAYDLKHENEKYVFVKKGLYDLFNE